MDAHQYVGVDLPRLVIPIVAFFGFVSFSAAVGAEFFGGAGLPRWARSCVLPGRAATTMGRVVRTSVFFVLAVFSPVLIIAALADSLQSRDVTGSAASITALAASVGWLAFIVRWLRLKGPVVVR